MLKMKKLELEFIPDPDMNIFVEKSTRVGISYISNRYSKANNKYLKSCDPKEELKHIIYLDANNLYGYAMPKFLQTSRFKWIDPKEFFDFNKYTSIVQKDLFLKLILNIQKNYKNYNMILHQLQMKQK